MGAAIRRADGTYRSWSAGGRPEGLVLGPGETWEERATNPGITPPPLTDAQKDGHLDGNKAVQAVATYFLQRINEERARHGEGAITGAQALDAVKAIYRGLA